MAGGIDLATGAGIADVVAACATSAPTTGGSTSEPDAARDAQVVAALECQMLVTPRRRFPARRAVAAYRVAMAYAELPGGDMGVSRRRAMACFAEASEIFAELGMVVEEARARNGTGSVYRALGQPAMAERHFTAALAGLEGAAAASEVAGAVSAVAAEIANNLGLVCSETGRLEEADRAFAQAMESFDCSEVDGRRGWASACVNRGLAAATRGDVDGLRAAIGFYQRVLDEVDASEVPYQHAMAWHGIGVVEMALAGGAGGAVEQVPGELEDGGLAVASGAEGGATAAIAGEVDEVGSLARAERAFGEARRRFAPQVFPYQYALSCHNLAEVHRRRGDVLSQRRALAYLEDALAVLDPHWFAALRAGISASLASTERRLALAGVPVTRAEHFAHLLAGCDEVERRWWLRERIGRLLALPAGARDDALGTLANALCRLDPKAFGVVLQAELQVLMEWPVPLQATALQAQLFAHRRLAPEAAHEADAVLDESITHALNGPQRVIVRDYLRTLGYERP